VLALVAAAPVAGAAVLAAGAIEWQNQDLGLLVALAVLAIVAERADVSVFGNARVSVSVVAILAAGTIAGLPGIVAVVPVVALADYVGRHKPLYKGIYNAGVLLLAGAAYVGVFQAFPTGTDAEDWPSLLIPGLAGTFANFAINSALVTIVIALDTKDEVSAVWNEKFRWLLPHYLVLGLLALALASAYRLVGLSGLAIVAPPLAMMWYVVRQYVGRTANAVAQAKQATREAARAKETHQADDYMLLRFAEALDRRHRPRVGYSQHVARLCLSIAERMGVEPGSQLWEDVRRAALLHDLGQDAIPESVLRHPGPLTPEQWSLVRRHPTVGHKLLRKLNSLKGAADIVHAHHERFDGGGYPRGLPAEKIPLGARIFAVADAFGAMTSDLPYRQARSPQAAILELQRCRGSQFDPEVVDAFLTIYREDNGHNRSAALAPS